MSHWMKGMIKDIQCSLDKMREAIQNVMPEWEGHIEVSPNGTITVRSSHNDQSKSGYHIRVAENIEIGVRYCDFGLKKADDDTWQLEYDKGGLPEKIQDAPNVLKSEISAMKMRERALAGGLNMIEDSRGKVRKQVIRMTKNEAEKFLATQ